MWHHLKATILVIPNESNGCSEHADFDAAPSNNNKVGLAKWKWWTLISKRNNKQKCRKCSLWLLSTKKTQNTCAPHNLRTEESGGKPMLRSSIIFFVKALRPNRSKSVFGKKLGERNLKTTHIIIGKSCFLFHFVKLMALVCKRASTCYHPKASLGWWNGQACIDEIPIFRVATGYRCGSS